MAASAQRQLQRGRRSSAALTQRASFGAVQVISEPRPREFVLHEVVPIALSTTSLLVPLVVVVTTSAALTPPVLLAVVLMLVLLLLTLWSTLLLLDVDAAPAPPAAKQSRRAKVRGIS